jgi:hypothetical protein
MNIVQDYGFEESILIDENGTAWPTGLYRHPDMDHPDHYFLNVEESSLLFSQPVFYCHPPTKQQVVLQVAELVSSSYDYILFEMQQDATYFVGDGGPQVDVFADINFHISRNTVIFELLYLSHNGWTVASRKAISPPPQPETITAGYITTIPNTSGVSTLYRTLFYIIQKYFSNCSWMIVRAYVAIHR